MLILLLSVLGVLIGLSEVNRFSESEVHHKTGHLSFSLINYQITHLNFLVHLLTLKRLVKDNW